MAKRYPRRRHTTEIHFEAGGRYYIGRLPEPEATTADVDGWACACGSSSVRGVAIADHDVHVEFIRGPAKCASCSEPAGQLRVRGVTALFAGCGWVGEDDTAEAANG